MSVASGVQWNPNFEPQWKKEICSNYQEAGKLVYSVWLVKGNGFVQKKRLQEFGILTVQYSLKEILKNSFMQGPA